MTIDRNLVYGALRAPLVLTYVGGVTSTQTSFRVLTGQEQPPQVTVVSQAPLRLQYGYSK